MTRQKKLTFFTAGYAQVSIVFPYIVVSPAYFAGAIQLGGLMQTASRLQQRAERAVVLHHRLPPARRMARRDRAAGRLRGCGRGRRARSRVTPPVVEVVAGASRMPAVEIDDVAVQLPNGKPLVAGDGVAIRAGEHVLVTGPSGSGKSTLFRAIAGIWPFGKGTHRGARGRAGDDAAAAAVFPGRHARPPR